MIKRKTLVTAALTLALLIAIAVLGLGVFSRTTLDSSSREFAVFVTPLILSANPDAAGITEDENAAAIERIEGTLAWETYAHPSLLRQQSAADRSKYLLMVTRNLGALEVLESISGGSDASFSPLNDGPARANYNLQVKFRRAAAEVQISMLYEQDQWQITAFQVISDETSD
ncbi:MAG: hypothetical protein COB20_08280 [SAR86 cluster bacterium]|uniref:DUF4019 domain-containing protein n=1 Tax=SAR86 cluster bacterium TaxID=2030880 RepID=A0A2A4X5L6_9GAMM|nr:MAG: hypothetical protein COB20_08280 [SAR86 cluster bacterium]